MLKKIRWGFLSTAKITDSLIGPIRQAARSELVAVASRNLDRAQAYAKAQDIPKAYGSYEALLADPDIDVIYNPLPNSLHYQWTIKAAEAGKHVLCEKPLVTRLADLDHIEKVSNTHNLTIFEGLKHLHHPHIIQAKQMIQSGRLGTLQAISSCFGFNLPLNDKNNIRLNPDLGGGALWDVGVYPCSLVIFMALAGAPIEVWASQTIGETGVDTSLFGQIRFANGVVAQISCSFLFPFRYQNTFVIGSEGLIQISEPWKSTDQNPKLVFVAKDGTEEIVVSRRNPFLCEVEAMEACVLDGSEPVIPLNLSRVVLTTILALYEAAHSGRKVPV
jgi:D-xylose 1-dehydrogenase (NADP+, D-xylono-1,5-lactone-forming)